MYEITRSFFNENRTDAGSWTNAQYMVFVRAGLMRKKDLAIIGWKEKLYGKFLTEEQAKKFFDARLVFAKVAKKDKARKHNLRSNKRAGG